MAAPSEARCGFRNVRAGEFCNVRAGDKAERSQVWVTDIESRAKRGVGYAMLLVIMIKKNLSTYASQCMQIYHRNTDIQTHTHTYTRTHTHTDTNTKITQKHAILKQPVASHHTRAFTGGTLAQIQVFPERN